MGTLNPFLKKKLGETQSPQAIPVIVEFPEGTEQDTLRQLQEISGLSVGDVSFNMVRVVAPLAVISQIEAIPGVIIHYDAPVGTVAAPTLTDPLLGDVALSSITIPFKPEEMPQRTLSLAMRTILSRASYDPNVIITPMEEVRKELRLPEDNTITKTKVAVLDTGLTLPHPAMGFGKGLIRLGTTIGPTPFDALGHGQWCCTALAGGKVRTRLGEHNGVADVKNGMFGSWKVLSDIGFGTSFAVIKGMELAWKWGAKIVSMSLGGPMQGSVNDDPQVRIIEKLKDQVIFVVAAGNDGVEWSIGSPGVAPSAVTVGSYSSVYGAVSTFSSRGPSGAWYFENPAVFKRDLSQYGENLYKPDLVAPGGGPSKEGQKMDLILSGVTGWTQPMYVILPDVWGAMRGTSMSTPLACGVIALAYEHGLINTAQDVKDKMARYGGKDSTVGYGMITYPKLV